MDAQRLWTVSRISDRRQSRRGVQREIHVRAIRTAWWILRHTRKPHTRFLPQFLPARGALAVLGPAPGTRSRKATVVMIRRKASRHGPGKQPAPLDVLMK